MSTPSKYVHVSELLRAEPTLKDDDEGEVDGVPR